MSLFFHRYTLVPKRPLSALAGRRPREGVLLRNGDGFADLHPWPELGDPPLDAQLAMLARGETTAQSRASLRFASIDADARARGVSLFENLTIPESHWPGDEPPAGFDTIKIKGMAAIPRNVRVRIDFNATLTAEQFLRIAETLPREQIDFIEDPCPYDDRTWRYLHETTHMRLALDLAVAGDRQQATEFDVLVHKPALQEWPSFNGEIVVTSYMDHPVGQLCAAYVAATHRVSARCGLMTHVLYEPDEFGERMRADGARLVAPGGTGIGFDDLLESLPWTKLS
jgi:O-succinylbenzoate synthase